MINTKNSKYRLIDLRSENEFYKGTIPNSFNVPILDNCAHKKVGIDYKENGRISAIQLANKLVSGEKKQDLIDKWIQAIIKYKITHIFCKRGGLRSSTAQRWLMEENVNVQILKGGYKNYRKKINNLHSRTDNYVGEWTVVGGYTGSRKTKLIKKLSSSIDLEGIAKHRGSTFGSTNEEQPTQQNFENILTQKYLESPPNLILENESRNIGGVALPGKFYDKMQLSNIVFIESNINDRVNNIYKEYVLTPLENGVEKKKLIQDYKLALMKIQNRLGGENHKKIRHELEISFNQKDCEGRLWIKLLLEKYYDKLYQYKLNILCKNIVFRGDWNSCLYYLNQKMI